MRRLLIRLLVVGNVLSAALALVGPAAAQNAEDLFRRGNAAAAKKEYDAAIRDYDAVIQLDPKHAAAFSNRGAAWQYKQEYDKAMKDYDAAIQLNPKFAVAFNNRGKLWTDLSEYGKAIRDFDEAIRLNPNDADFFNNRGAAWRARKDDAKAFQDYDEAVRLDPKFVKAVYNRGMVFKAQKQYAKAVRDFDEAIRLDSEGPYYFNSKARLLATCPDEKVRDGGKAVELATRACVLTEWKDPRYLSTLAAAYAEAGDYAKAVECQEKALKDPDYEKKFGVSTRRRLQLYKDKKPLRED